MAATAHPPAEPRFGQRAARWLKKEALPLLIMLGLLAAARDTLANHYVVPTGSMQPTLEPGDRVVVDMRAYGLRLPFTDIELLHGQAPQRGDVVVFDSPLDGTRLIKRVVAVAGDQVQLHAGHLSINGQPLALPGPLPREAFGARTATLDLDMGGGLDILGTVVPPGQLLMLGDHRGNSADGRYFGFVEARTVYGRAVAIYHRRGEALGWRRL